MLDIKIAGARVVDGTGNPWRREDVGIRDGRIVAIGAVRERARKQVKGSGRILCPGFIDVHTHADGIRNEPAAANFVRQGVTTVVSGNCGGSALPMGAMLDQVTACRPAINYATLIGYNTVRQHVMGMADRPPGKREMAQIRRLIEQAMREGALGISTGLFYLPGAYTELDELVEASKPVAAWNGIYATHARSAGGKLPEAIEETAQISRRAGLPAQISHLKVLHRRGRTAKQRGADMLALIAQRRAEGIDLAYDLHPYNATNTSLSSVVLPPWISRDGVRDQRLKDAAIRAKIRAEVNGRIAWIGGPAKIQLVRFAPDPSLIGLDLADIARRRRQPAAATAMDLVLEGNPSCLFHALRLEDVRLFLNDALSMVASDAHVVQKSETLAHPRNFGTFPRILREYVRENRWLRLETAIRKMTAAPAARYRIPNRGLIAMGYAADLVLFNPETINDKATFEKPLVYPDGIDMVLVNGAIAWHAGSKRILRHGVAITA